MDIAIIGAAGFHRCVKSKTTDVFMTSLCEIEQALETEKERTAKSTESEEIKQQLPDQYREFADVFSKIRSDELPVHQKYDHKIELNQDLELGYSPLYRMSEEQLQVA